MDAGYVPQRREPPPLAAADPKGLADIYERAVNSHRRGELAVASELYAQILRVNPKHDGALHMLGTASLQSGDLQTGVKLISQSLEINPSQPAAYSALGNAMRSLRQPEEALRLFDRAIELDSTHAPAHNNRGIVLSDLGRIPEALESYERALSLSPAHFGALVNYGNALLRANKVEQAMATFEQALQQRPDSARPLFGYAEGLRSLRRFQEALAVLDRALQLEPASARGWYDHACVLHELRRLSDALVSYDRAISLDPADAKAYCYRGSALLELNRHEAAAESFAAAVKLAPDFPYAIGSLLQARMAQCDWTEWQQDVDRVIVAISRGSPAIFPIALLVASDSPAPHLKLAKTYLQMYPPLAPASPTAYEHSRIRIAYVSGDFRDHPVSQLLTGVLERHDRERFEVIAVGLQPPDHSALGQRIRSAADQFIDVSRQSDESVAQWLRRREVDIVVDLQGITQGMRAEILSRRPAGIQVNYLGFPATMGAPYIDYIIGDEVVIPAGAEEHYSETVVRLPHTFLPFDDRQGIAERLPTREEAGLSASGLVLCDFNNHIKITPGVFEVWMRWLRGIPGSCLWLRWAQGKVQENLRREAQARGVAGERIVFAGKVPTLDEHLSRQRLADLFVDTLPYNAHATAAQALWAGVPVLTCQGASFAGRVASSLLTAVGLPELITQDLQQYERVGFELAREPQRLAALRERLAATRQRAPLFDTATYTRHLEAAYQLMIERHRRGLPPTHLWVPVPGTAS